MGSTSAHSTPPILAERAGPKGTAPVGAVLRTPFFYL